MSNYNVVATGSTKIKDHKGGRIWLEGGKLVKAGLGAGTFYDVYIEDNALFIIRAEDGARKVSGKESRPIIDLCLQEIGKAFGLGTKVAVTYADGLITIVEDRRQ